MMQRRHRRMFRGVSHRSNSGRLASFALLAVVIGLTQGSSVHADKNKKLDYGVIRILTTPGGFPLTIDGKSEGETTSEFREFPLPPGTHTIMITLPTGQSWTREISIAAGRKKCVALNYRPPAPPPNSPCPYPVNVSAPGTVNEGDVIT